MVRRGINRLQGRVVRFLALDNAGEMILLAMAILGMVCANSPASAGYDALLHLDLGLGWLDLSVEHWITEGLMALFFLLVGLEVKRELLQGELSSPRRIALPAIAAIGGVVVPVLLYRLIAGQDGAVARGWAIPAATDIAFALAALSAWGRGLPRGLFIFLSSLAIFDDLAAILIIAVYYTDDLSGGGLLMSGVALGLLLTFNLAGVRRLWPYLGVGALLWLAILQSGIHATMAGALLALTIPLRPAPRRATPPSLAVPRQHGAGRGESPLSRLESALHPLVYFLVLPLFGFVSTGITFADLSLDTLWQPVTLGIIAGLVVGKQLGVLLFTAVALKLGLGTLPRGTRFSAFYGVALLCGIGFTMSMFIADLAFTDPRYVNEAKLGTIVGSALSALAGGIWLRWTRSAQVSAEPPTDAVA